MGILKEEEEKAKIQKDLSILTDRLSKINESLARKVQARNEYDKTIQETEAAYMKVGANCRRCYRSCLKADLRILAVLDLGEFADTPSRAQEGDRQSYQKEAILLINAGRCDDSGRFVERCAEVGNRLRRAAAGGLMLIIAPA